MAAATKKKINIPRLSLSVLLGFALLMFLGWLLHLTGENSKSWWWALLPIWFIASWALYSKALAKVGT